MNFLKSTTLQAHLHKIKTLASSLFAAVGTSLRSSGCIRSILLLARDLSVSTKQAAMKALSIMGEHKGAAGAVGFILVSMLFALLYYLRLPNKATYYIAYIGRYQSQGLDELQERLLTQYIDALNAHISDMKFELRAFRIKTPYNTYDSRGAYQTIANDSKVVMVLDNTWGENLASVANLITENNIPVISMNADTQNKDYKSHVIFIGYDDHVPEKIIIFAKKILPDQAHVIVAEDESIFPSTATLANAFPGVTPLTLHSHTVNSGENATVDAAIQQLNCAASNERRALIVNTHWSWGEEIINRVSAQCRNVDILGGPYIVSQQKIRNEPDEEAEGKTDEIILRNGNRLILFTRSKDAISDRVHREAEDIKRLWPQRNPELFIERCIHATAIIEQAMSSIKKNNIKNKNRSISKESFVTALRNMANHMFIKSDDDIYSEVYSFDNKLCLSDDRIFEQYSNGEISSYPQQLSSTDGPIPNIHVGVEDIQISSIDTKNSSFHAHFIYWWKCTDPRIDPNAYLFFRNQTKGDLEDKGKPELLVNEDHGADGKYQLFKVSGDFEMQTDLTRYPLDRQEINIELAAVYPRDKVQISFDDESSKSLDRKVRVSSNEWDKEDSYFTVDNILGESFGGNATTAAKKHQIFETLNIRTKIKRNPIYSYITILVPLLMIGLVAVSVLFVRDGSFESIGHVCVVIFLAIATYRITFAELIPNAGHLTVADKLLFGAFVTIFFVFSKVIILNSGLISNDLQEWLRHRTLIIGCLGMTIYCVMAAFALIF